MGMGTGMALRHELPSTYVQVLGPVKVDHQQVVFIGLGRLGTAIQAEKAVGHRSAHRSSGPDTSWGPYDISSSSSSWWRDIDANDAQVGQHPAQQTGQHAQHPRDGGLSSAGQNNCSRPAVLPSCPPSCPFAANPSAGQATPGPWLPGLPVCTRFVLALVLGRTGLGLLDPGRPHRRFDRPAAPPCIAMCVLRTHSVTIPGYCSLTLHTA
ncbi:hypothetical protein F4780DRAFT_241860 [Xylariomycetidae sp. FL0641]|nr:hypothetical protein F4780DRAFT_241860 [Xylariomycetidae sp. FL0641]